MLSIKKSVIRDFTHYSMIKTPEEACGLLLSTEGKIIDQFWPIKNISTTPLRHFIFDPKEFIHSLYEIEELTFTWIGVIHSHPTVSSYPSKVDIANWHYPDKSYWIFSLPENSINAYWIERGRIKEEGIQIID